MKALPLIPARYGFEITQINAHNPSGLQSKMAKMHYTRALSTSFSLFILGVTLGLTASGCDGSKKPAMGSVHGKVLFQGQPIPNASLSFSHESNGDGILVPIESDGTYQTARTLSVGTYQVAILPPMATPKMNAPPSKIKIPQKYQDKQKSGLQVKIEAKSNQFDVNVE